MQKIRRNTRFLKRFKTTLSINKSVKGESIESMLERLKNGEGEEGIADRDLVYNDNEASAVNPITNIRSDKMELMLEEKIGEYEHKNKPKMKVVKDEEPKEKSSDGDGTSGDVE